MISMRQSAGTPSPHHAAPQTTVKVQALHNMRRIANSKHKTHLHGALFLYVCLCPPLYRFGIEVPLESSSPLTGHTNAFSYPSTPREMAHCSDTRIFRIRVFRICADSPPEHKVRFTRRKPMTLNLKLYAAK